MIKRLGKEPGMSRKTCKLIVLSVIGICILLFFLRCCTGVLFFENRTSSAPQGIYVRCFGKVGYDDYVVVALDKDVAALKKGNLLLKRAKGFPGDIYVVNEKSLGIRGQVFRIQQVPGLPRLNRGSYMVLEKEIFLLNDSENSFDSRYLGPVKQDSIRAKVTMLVPYGPLVRFFGKEGWGK